MEITQERLNELKSQIQIEKPLGTLLRDSLVVTKPVAKPVAAAVPSDDCQSFGFDIKVLKISGSFCKSGKLDLTGSVFGIEIGHSTLDISQAEICQNPKLGKLVSVKYCFSLENNCLYTQGETDGWFGRMEWNEKLLCF